MRIEDREHETGSGPTPRPEYPRPQFRRERWMNLNGPWTCQFDPLGEGEAKGYAESRGFDTPILVPFCPESRLSGIGYTDFIEGLWYHRRLAVPESWSGSRVLLHFGAVDFESEVYIDGVPVGRHWGGSASFHHDITACVQFGGTHDLVVRVRDVRRSGTQPGGKQSDRLHSYACCYTRTTGIWQTVWMEPVPAEGFKDCRIVPDVDAGRFLLTPRFRDTRRGNTVTVTVRETGERVTAAAVSGLTLELPVRDPALWSPGNPHLYDIDLEVRDPGGAVVDAVAAYGGLRKVHVEGNRVFLNNAPLYQRLVLDQGYYPDGLWTAPDDAALRRDIELGKAAGFNGARLHQKVFEERFHYWADRLGYLTWAESASWGGDMNRVETARNFLPEWGEVVSRDRNHPSIIAWTPFNESWERDHQAPHGHDRLVHDAYRLTHDLDGTRPVNDVSGNFHQVTDLFTIHTYLQDPEELGRYLEKRGGRVAQYKYHAVWLSEPGRVEEVARTSTVECEYAGQPLLVDEYGGIKWAPEDALDSQTESWGYGTGPKDLEAFHERLRALTERILERDHIAGYCYTQLTDVEQEKNGIYRYDRSPKFDLERIRAVFGRNPAWFETERGTTQEGPRDAG